MLLLVPRKSSTQAIDSMLRTALLLEEFLQHRSQAIYIRKGYL